MKQESDLKPKNKFEIENINGNRCEVVFFDLNSIEEEKRTDENGEEKTFYKYLSYRQNMNYNENLNEYIEESYNDLLNTAKKLDYDKYAKIIREQRDNLLQESDKVMAFDRIDFDIPETITMGTIITVLKSFFNVLSNIKNGAWANYRQELRDITKQEGFPYNVEFPKKPKE